MTYKPLLYNLQTNKIVYKGEEDMITDIFAQRIKSIRREKGISQEKFALKIDMDRTYYASVEAGKRNISLNNIKKIADGFDMTLEEMFKGM